MSRFVIRMPDDIQPDMERLSDEHDRSINSEIIQACKAWVAAERKTSMKEPVTGYKIDGKEYSFDEPLPASVMQSPWEQAMQIRLLEIFLKSDDFKEGVISATKAGWGGSGYSVELFPDGTWRVLWDNEIGNLYNSPGEIMRLSKLNDNDYQECLDEGMTEEEYFEQAFILQQDDLKGEMRDSW